MPDTSQRSVRFCGAVLLVLSLCASAGAADSAATDDPAQRVADAEVLAERAYAAYAGGDYAAAVALYHQAFERAPSADALFNIARVYDLGLRDRELAMRFYRRYLSDPGARPERIQRANQRLAELRLAEEAEQAALAPSSTTARAASAREARSSVEAEPGLSSWQVAALATGAAGVVVASLGAVFGVAVLSDAERANADCDGNRCRSQMGLDAAHAASRHATFATWGVAAGAGLMASGALLWLLAPDAHAAEPGEDLQVAAVAGSSQLGLALSGRW